VLSLNVLPGHLLRLLSK